VGSLRRGPSPCLRRHRRRSASRALRRRPSLCLNRHVRRSRSLRRRPSPHLRRHRLGPRRGLCAAALLSALTGTAVGPGPTPPPISPPQTAPPRSTSRPLRHRPCLCLNRHRRRSRSLRGRPSPCRSGHRRSRRLSLPQGHRLGSTRPARCLVVAASRGTAVPPEPLPLLQGHRQGTGPPPSSPLTRDGRFRASLPVSAAGRRHGSVPTGLLPAAPRHPVFAPTFPAPGHRADPPGRAPPFFLGHAALLRMAPALAAGVCRREPAASRWSGSADRPGLARPVARCGFAVHPPRDRPKMPESGPS
jgi:hypothetical protein